MTEETVNVYEVSEADRDMGSLVGKRWSGCVLATLAIVQGVHEHRGSSTAMVWPDEGRFDQQGMWRFNEAHKDFEPLLLDMQTANMLVTVYNNLRSPEVREKVTDWISRGRGHFGRIVELGWGAVTPK